MLIAPSTSPSLRLVHETKGLLFIDKPAGLSFHAEGAGQGGIQAPGVMQLLRAMQADGELAHDGRLYGVHRLDRVTSGLLMVAKNADAAREVGALLRERRLHKYYVALSGRKPSKKMGRVSGDMERSRRGSWKLLRSMDRPAVTTFLSESIVDAPLSDAVARPLRAFVLKPLSGRTHQLRVAMKCLGSPVLGDALYAAAADAAMEDRAYLHSAALRLPAGYSHLSEDGEPVEVVCTPTHGDKFTSPAFASAFGRWFDAGSDVWFGGTPIKSSLVALAEG